MFYTLTVSLFLTNMLIFKQISEKNDRKEILRVKKRHIVFFDRLISLYFFWSTGQTGFSGIIRKISGWDIQDRDNSKVCLTELYKIHYKMQREKLYNL